MGDEDKKHVKSWSDLNPEFTHEVYTAEMRESYVKEHFNVSHPHIVELYFEVQDYIVRLDLIRYLFLWLEGGVYNDLDVSCEKPIRTWLPSQYHDSASLVLGVQIDNMFGPDGRTFNGGTFLFELVNWTIMAKPNHPFMWFIIQRQLENLKNMAASRGQHISKLTYSTQDVLSVAGPAALTKAFLDWASNVTDSTVTGQNFTKMTEPRLIEDVVILPIQAFGAGHQVEWAKMEPANGKELVHHYFAGSWRTDHFDEAPQPSDTDEEQKKKEEEEKKVEEEKAKAAEEEKKKQAEEGRKKQEDALKAAEGEKQKGEQGMKEATNANSGTGNEADSTGTSATADSTTSDSTPSDAANTTDSQSSSDSSEEQSSEPEHGQTNESEDNGKQEDKPASVKYMENQAEFEKPAETSPTSIKEMIAENAAKYSNASIPLTTPEDTKAKEEAEYAAKKAAAEAKHKAFKAEAEAKEKAAEDKARAEALAQLEAQKYKTKEEIEEEERRKAFEEIKAVAPKWAPKKHGDEFTSSNNLADYDLELG